MITRALAAVAILSIALTINAQHRPAPGPVSAVAKLYQDFAAEAVIDDPTLSIAGVFGSPRAILAKYFDGSLVSLMLADTQCRRQSHELCRLGFSPIWDSQDPVGTTVRIVPTSDPARVLVELRYLARPEPRRLTYRIIQSPAGWRIADIEYGEHARL